MYFRLFLMTTTLMASASVASQPALAADFYVAPDGRDNGPGTIGQPFATLARARDAVRGVAKDRDIVIAVRGGTYALTETLVFGPQDSGSPQARVIYEAYPGETPVITGGRRITGWKRLADDAPGVAPTARGRLWVANVPKGWLFDQLLVNGAPQPRSRRPDTDDWKTWPTIRAIGAPEASGQLVTFPPGALDGVAGNGDVEVCFLPSYRWMNQLFVLRDVDPAAATGRRHSRNVTYVGAAGDPFRIENALNAIEKPGQWCVDSAAGRVYHWPISGTMDGVEAIAPHLTNLVQFQGDESAGRWVHHIELRGLTFTSTDRLSEDAWPPEWLKRNFECPDAGLFMQGVEDCTIEGNRFVHLGAYAIALDHHAQRVRIAGNEMSHLGCGGVQIYGYGSGTRDENHHNVVSRNHIHHIGLSYWHSGAITISGSGSNRITLNYIHDLPYAGIMISGVFVDAFNRPTHNTDAYGGGDAIFNIRWEDLPPGSRERFIASAGAFTRRSVKEFQHSGDNLVEHNIVINSMQTLVDGGALYAFACGLGNVWRRNLIHDPKPTESLFPLYMDDEVDGATLEGNVAWSPGTPMTKGDNQFIGNIVSPNRPPEFDRLRDQITEAAHQEGGWLGDDSFDLSN